MGELYLLMSEYDEAKKCLEEALNMDESQGAGSPDYSRTAKPAANLGVLCVRREEYTNAIDYFQRALRIDPDDLSLRSNLAEAYLKNKQLDRAESEFNAVLERAPCHVESIIGLGEVYVALAEMGDADLFETAVERYGQAIRLGVQKQGSKRLKKSELAGVYYARGYARVRIYEVSGTPLDCSPLSDALKDFNQCFSLNPTHFRAKRAIEKVKKLLPRYSPQGAIERWGPAVVVAMSLIVFITAQVVFFAPFFASRSQFLSANHYVALTTGSIVLLVAGVYLPRVIKLRVAGVELEKSAVDHVTTIGTVGIGQEKTSRRR
jgi:tetratricopeptide (TPR) repeat protein